MQPNSHKGSPDTISTPFPLYRAVVEDNVDPDKLGRVRVRIFGLHSEENENSGNPFEFVKTDQLPWAEVMNSVGLVGGVGLSTVLRQGTWVWVILENNDPNKPIVIGSIIGKVSVPGEGVYDSGKGFSDPDGEYPFVSRGSESDLNRLARSEKHSEQYYDKTTNVPYANPDQNVTSKDLDSTIHDKINQTVNNVSSTDSPTASGPTLSRNWTTNPTHTEPNSLSDKTVYPDSSVIETHSGHVVEIDDTDGNERIRVYHRTGSYFEIRPDGSFIQKSVGNEGNHYIHMADVHEHIEAAVKRYIKNGVDEIIDSTVKREINGDKLQHITSDYAMKVDGNFILEVGGNIEFKVAGHREENIGSYHKEVIGSTININSGGSHTVSNGGNHSVTAPRIDLN